MPGSGVCVLMFGHLILEFFAWLLPHCSALHIATILVFVLFSAGFAGGLGVVFFSFWPIGADMLPSSQQVLICFPTAYCFPNASGVLHPIAMFIGTFMLSLTPIIVFPVVVISNCYYPSSSGPRVEVLLRPWLWGHRGGL
ncbi:hypothetical protein U1Q18_031522, partial [Sarracenia purpurea var. burkii]